MTTECRSCLTDKFVNSRSCSGRCHKQKVYKGSDRTARLMSRFPDLLVDATGAGQTHSTAKPQIQLEIKSVANVVARVIFRECVWHRNESGPNESDDFDDVASLSYKRRQRSFILAKDNGVPKYFLVDYGSEITVVDHSVAKQLKSTPNP